MKKKLNKGVLISIEGIDGCGKSMLCKTLGEALEQEYEVILTKEPGGSELGKSLREILQNKKVSPLAEYLLYAADRAQHFKELIIPTLKEKKIILSDRMADSSLAYQGFGRKIDIDFIKMVNNIVMQSLKPDLTIYLRIDLEIAQTRIRKRNAELTVMEKEESQFMQRVSDAFEEIYRDKDNIIVVDANQLPESILETVLKRVKNYLNDIK